MTKTDLELAIRVNTHEEVENAVRDLVGDACLGLTNQEKFVLLLNWKLETALLAEKFRHLADYNLKKNTKEEFLSARILSKHEGHLLMVICWRTTMDEFLKTVQAAFGGGTFSMPK